MSLDRSGMADFLTNLSEPISHARTLVQWIHRRRTLDFSAMSDLSKRLRAKLMAQGTITVPELMQERLSADGTYKWLLKLTDGNAIETVYIPPLEGEERGTLCISSQVGCGLNCRFCATAQSGFNRNLSTAEIIGQLWWATARVPKITNVVMMGMGEPLLNYEAVISALNLMLDPCAYGLSKYRVTVSTAGLVPAMEKLRLDSPVSLAVSLHAPNNTLRSELVPLNKKYPLEKLIPVCREYYPAHAKQAILFEYVMLSGVNDSLAQAQELVELISAIPCKVNLIPFNPFPGTSYQCSNPESISAFQNYLISAGIPTWIRRTRGDDIEGACGQLAGRFKDRTGRSSKSSHYLT